MKIGICDDEEQQRKYMLQLCRQYEKKSGLKCEIIEFASGEEVLTYEGTRITLLLLDIEMAGLDGIKVMKKLEHSELVWRIIFVSSHQERVFSTFGIKTLQFGRKPITYKQLEKWMQIAVDEANDDIIVKFDEDKKKWFPISEILYLRAEGSYVNVYTRGEVVFLSRNLKYWENKLPKVGLQRVHKSYVVNLDYIIDIRDGVKLSFNGEIIDIPIGKKYRRELKEIYTNHLLKKIHGRV